MAYIFVPAPDAHGVVTATLHESDRTDLPQRAVETLADVNALRRAWGVDDVRGDGFVALASPGRTPPMRHSRL